MESSSGKRIVAFLVFPAIVAGTFWDGGYGAVVGVFVLMLLIDAFIIWLAQQLSGKRTE